MASGLVGACHGANLRRVAASTGEQPQGLRQVDRRWHGRLPPVRRRLVALDYASGVCRHITEASVAQLVFPIAHSGLSSGSDDGGDPFQRYDPWAALPARVAPHQLAPSAPPQASQRRFSPRQESEASSAVTERFSSVERQIDSVLKAQVEIVGSQARAWDMRFREVHERIDQLQKGSAISELQGELADVRSQILILRHCVDQWEEEEVSDESVASWTTTSTAGSSSWRAA